MGQSVSNVSRDLLRRGVPLCALLALAGATALARPASAAAPTPHVRASLASEWEAAPQEGPFWVAVRLALDPGWHVYWRHPGDSGLAPSVAWTLPGGLVAGP